MYFERETEEKLKNSYFFLIIDSVYNTFAHPANIKNTTSLLAIKI